MKVFVTTGCGNIIQGGADMWTNNFIELVFPHLTNSFILVDGRKPNGWKDTYGLEKSNKLHFHFDNPQKTEQILEKLEAYKNTEADQKMLLTVLKVQQLVGEINNNASSD